ncbi:hypothetical protein [Rhizobium oryzicola]|uniref:Uncharacterized protein n=1 Tax=Rhizobium oryzicola TaxID=1232668 RepID=A0ABT8SYB9_9HYPH|nr:hypothetical protein [Rhizobium oryzicola]MDO1583204.1 hypothetical protein [Rhizobium oryzicola]
MWRFDFAVVADLTANVFATCFLLFLLGWQNGSADRDERAHAQARLFRVEEREALSGQDRVVMLFRRGDPGVLRFDLLGDHVLVLRPGLPPFRADAGSIAAALVNASGPAVLYVFDNRFYYPVVNALHHMGVVFREMDVPEALSAREPDRRGWSTGFLDLIASQPDRAEFSAGLSRLLEAVGSPGAGVAGPTAHDGTNDAVSPVTKLLESVTRCVAILLLIVGFALAGFTEWWFPPQTQA